MNSKGKKGKRAVNSLFFYDFFHVQNTISGIMCPKWPYSIKGKMDIMDIIIMVFICSCVLVFITIKTKIVFVTNQSKSRKANAYDLLSNTIEWQGAIAICRSHFPLGEYKNNERKRVLMKKRMSLRECQNNSLRSLFRMDLVSSITLARSLMELIIRLGFDCYEHTKTIQYVFIMTQFAIAHKIRLL
ncbi:Uncharacterised protein [Yersinia pseudotuberculosis]|nr:Uncharacterised protein [Yersinia pseudotuberculosis]